MPEQVALTVLLGAAIAPQAQHLGMVLQLLCMGIPFCSLWSAGLVVVARTLMAMHMAVAAAAGLY